MRRKLAIAAALVVLLAVFLIPRPLHGQPPQTAPVPLSPEDLQVYRRAHTVIDWSPKEIRQELADLQPAQSQLDLDRILQQVESRVLAFVDNFPNTTATDSIQWQLDDHKLFRVESHIGPAPYFLTGCV